MSDSFALALFLLAVVLVVGLLGCVATGRPGHRARNGLTGLGIGLVVQAIGHLIGLATGHQSAEPVVQIAYLAVSVVVVPIGFVLARPGESGRGSVAEPDRWSAALLALTALIAGVLVLRIQTTWRHG